MKKNFSLLMSITFFLILGVPFAAENAVLPSTPVSTENPRQAEMKMDKQERKKATREKAKAAKKNAVSRVKYMKANPVSRIKSMDAKTKKIGPAEN